MSSLQREVTIAKKILTNGMEQGDCRQVDECRCADCFEYAREVLSEKGCICYMPN